MTVTHGTYTEQQLAHTGAAFTAEEAAKRAKRVMRVAVEVDGASMAQGARAKDEAIDMVLSKIAARFQDPEAAETAHRVGLTNYRKFKDIDKALTAARRAGYRIEAQG